MIAAVFASALAGTEQTPSRLSRLARRVMNALIESRQTSALRELHRHEAFMNDLGRKQDHSPEFLTQDNALPFRI
jgi:hypothetical protein